MAGLGFGVDGVALAASCCEPQQRCGNNLRDAKNRRLRDQTVCQNAPKLCAKTRSCVPKLEKGWSLKMGKTKIAAKADGDDASVIGAARKTRKSGAVATAGEAVAPPVAAAHKIAMPDAGVAAASAHKTAITAHETAARPAKAAITRRNAAKPDSGGAGGVAGEGGAAKAARATRASRAAKTADAALPAIGAAKPDSGGVVGAADTPKAARATRVAKAIDSGATKPAQVAKSKKTADSALPAIGATKPDSGGAGGVAGEGGAAKAARATRASRATKSADAALPADSAANASQATQAVRAAKTIDSGATKPAQAAKSKKTADAALPAIGGQDAGTPGTAKVISLESAAAARGTAHKRRSPGAPRQPEATASAAQPAPSPRAPAKSGAAPQPAAAPATPVARSNDQVDVARRLLELSGTIEEAIGYLSSYSQHTNPGMAGMMLKIIGEGLIGVEKAVLAVSDPLARDKASAEKLSGSFYGITEKLNGMIDAYASERYPELNWMCSSFREAYAGYAALLSACFREATLI
jgi:hypothetical protein